VLGYGRRRPVRLQDAVDPYAVLNRNARMGGKRLNLSAACFTHCSSYFLPATFAVVGRVMSSGPGFESVQGGGC